MSVLGRAPRGRESLVEEESTQKVVDWSGSYRAARPGNRKGWSLVTKVALGGWAIRWAVTWVKPEQASKVTMRMPTLRPFGEGCTRGEAIDTRTHAIRRGSGHGTSEEWFG